MIFTDPYSQDDRYTTEIVGLPRGQFLIENKSVTEAMVKWQSLINENRVSKKYLGRRTQDYSGELIHKNSSSKKAAGSCSQRLNDSMGAIAAFSATTVSISVAILGYFRFFLIGDDEDREKIFLIVVVALLGIVAVVQIMAAIFLCCFRTKTNKRAARDNLDNNLRELLKRLPAIEYELKLKNTIFSVFKNILPAYIDELQLSAIFEDFRTPEFSDNFLERYLAVVMENKKDLNKYKTI